MAATSLFWKMLLIISLIIAVFCYPGSYPLTPKLKTPANPGTAANAPGNASEIPLVDLAKTDKTLVLDIRYATDKNFTGRKIYPAPKAYLRLGTAHKMLAAHQELAGMGYGIKVFDAYRPYYVQQILYDAASPEGKRYLADPREGSYHNRGAAVDITLTDLKGQELPMPSNFDEFNFKAHRNYRGGSREAINNRDVLTKVMLKHGFTAIESEWWHFNDSQAMKYPILDIKLEDLP